MIPDEAEETDLRHGGDVGPDQRAFQNRVLHLADIEVEAKAADVCVPLAIELPKREHCHPRG